jgi:hypothetical protein
MSIKVYFVHDKLTLENVRFTWTDAPQCPAVGERITGEFGYEGALVTWEVANVEWLYGVEGRSVTCHMTDPADFR